jgi:hypothetical protein
MITSKGGLWSWRWVKQDEIVSSSSNVGIMIPIRAAIESQEFMIV